MRFTAQLTTLTALAVNSLPILAVKNGRTFAVMHFYGKGPLVTARMDPIVNPGVVAAHMHTIMGGNAFSMNMPGDTATQATCTNARLKNDKSNYWTPSLYFNNGNGFEPVQMFYMNVYYFFEGTDDNIVAFPPGFRMVSGNPSLRAPPKSGGRLVLNAADGEISPIHWTCPRRNTSTPLYPPNSDGLHGVGIQDPNNKGAGVGFSDKNCDGYASPLRADIHFPSCYDPSAGPENYHNNTAWPSSAGASGPGKQNCPPGFIHLPHVFYEVYWNTPKFADRWTPGQGKQPFVLSNGDPTGYSLHGDFLNGWDTATLQTIIDTCDAGTAGMDKCPQIIGGVNDPSGTCNIQSPINDVNTGSMSALPGCNPLQYSPGPAVQYTCNGGTPVPANNPPASSASDSGAASSAPVVHLSSTAKMIVATAHTSHTTMATVTQPAATYVITHGVVPAGPATSVTSSPAEASTTPHHHHTHHGRTRHRHLKTKTVVAAVQTATIPCV